MGTNLRDRVVAKREPAGTDVEKPKTLAEQIEAKRSVFQAALPDGAEARILIRDAMSLVRVQPRLAQCNVNTVLGGLMTFAQLGLRPGVLGHGWLIPFKKRTYDRDTKQWVETWEAQVVLGYKGYAELIYRTGSAQTMVSRQVHANDHFELEYGIEDRLVHRPQMDGPRGEVTGYYSVIKFQGGGYVFWYMTKTECEEWRDKYAMARKPVYEGGKRTDRIEIVGPWKDNFDAMALKGLAVDTPIPTPGGWSTMGALSIGDEVIDMHGQPCRVLAKSEVKHLDCYRVTFGNGESVVCDAEHLWLARAGRNDGRGTYRQFTGARRAWTVYRIDELHRAKEAGLSVTMPVAEPADLPAADLPIDPWVLGYWLGDGAKDAPVVTCNTGNVAEITAAIASAGYEVGAVRPDPRSNAVGVYIKGIKKLLAELGVLGHKHVPDMYLRGSARQRLALLRGLMDSDGAIDYRGRARFTNTDAGLADAVAELARSLGEMVQRGEVETTGYGKTVTSLWVSWLPTVAPVTLARKARRVKAREVAGYRTVKAIEVVPSVPTQCIGVDAPTRTYLAGRDWAPTHNTTFLRAQNLAPKTTQLARAIAVDGGVRRDMGEADEMFFAEHPTPNVIDGELADDNPVLPDPATHPEVWHAEGHPRRNEQGEIVYVDHAPDWCELCAPATTEETTDSK